MASKPKTIRHGAPARTKSGPTSVRAFARRAALPGATLAGLVWAVASMFAPAPAPRAEAALPVAQVDVISTARAAVAPQTSGRLAAKPHQLAAPSPRPAETAPAKSARVAAPDVEAEDGFDAVVRSAALTPDRIRAAFHADRFEEVVRRTALTPDRMRVAFQNAFLVADMKRAAGGAAVEVAAAETQAMPEAGAEVAALTPAVVPLPQFRPRQAEAAKPDKAVVAVAALKPDKPAAEKPAGLLAGFLSARPEQPAAPEKPAKPAKTLKPAKPGKPEVAMAAMAFARPDSPDRGMTNAFNGLFNKPNAGNRVAVYDISAGVVIMPNGERLEAHSGIGHMADNPRFVHVKMKGPTPPNTYKLSMREKRFHGVEAIRMTPVGDDPMHGRTGILAHSYLLRGRAAQSHGCVAFKDYQRFLKAFKAGHVTHMVVVPGNGGGSRKQTVAVNDV